MKSLHTSKFIADKQLASWGISLRQYNWLAERATCFRSHQDLESLLKQWRKKADHLFRSEDDNISEAGSRLFKTAVSLQKALRA